METSVNNGMCRCCASEGAFKDVKSTYHWMGEEEIYSDMLRDCFDINLEVSEQGQDGGICEVCITQLRNAINFKKQVLHTEEQFKIHLQNKTMFRPNIVKVELQAGEDSDDLGSGDDAFSGPEFEVPIKMETEETKPKKRGAKASATTTRAKKAKTDNGETSNKRKPNEKLENSEHNDTNISDSESIPENDMFIERDQDKTASRTDLAKHRNNIKEILMNSNATPIRRHIGIGYTCSYCEDQYVKPGDLKRHTLDTHKDVKEANFMKSMNLSEYVVKIDITRLKCKLCNKEINTLDLFIEHLHKDHDRKFYFDVKSHIFPFKFDTDVLQCYICLNTFNKFRALVNHMHIHFRNFICKICDSGFVNRNALTQHTVHHTKGSFVCDHCPKILPSLVRKRLHERSAHTDYIFKCSHCIETFKEYHQREAHVSAVHGISSATVCQACNKVFSSRKRLNIHTKRDHLMDRPHKCKDCDMAFFSTTGLKNHTVKHTGAKDFQCTVCLKSFARKKTLNAHIKIHDTDLHIQCEICDQKFSQKWSMKSHMKTKHGSSAE
ncbi:PR domain zinc finger protein 5-like isoform X5 [Helicoverpa zea]|uniref:PR domain zinc finger protein 5-like isoform X5 n=1 Tax=Helicoverpa zea TaxID=7113 RepID=UPI001F585E04|nr:PR domain zinc finger protein 5-like isoform X5 [Helicoverpa zea]